MDAVSDYSTHSSCNGRHKGRTSTAMVFAAFGFTSHAAGALIQEAFDVIVILNALQAGKAIF